MHIDRKKLEEEANFRFISTYKSVKPNTDQKRIDRYQIKDKEGDIKETINHILAMNKPKADVVAVLWARENGENRLSMRSRKKDVWLP